MRFLIRLQTTLAAVTMVITLLPPTSSAEYVPLDSSERAELAAPAEPPYRTDRLLVKPKKDLPLGMLANVHAANRARAIRTFHKIGNLQVVRLPAGADVRKFVARYQKTGLVEYAEPDYIVHAFVTEPNDPYYQDGSLWALNNTGQGGGTPDADIDAPEGWDLIHDAPSVVVAVIDTGVRYTHEDLEGNMWENPGEVPGNGQDDDQNGYVDDVYGINAITGSGDPMDDAGHGTHCSGTIGAVGDNGIGVVGVAWQVQLMACKFLNSGGGGYASDAIECVDYARTMGAHIMSNSWGGTYFSQALRDAIASARDAGVIFVVAAGNSKADMEYTPHYPAGYDLDNIVSVAATDRNDELWSSSNYGLESVDLAAPGKDIYSTCLHTWYPEVLYCAKNGTSMAAPHVSGALALLRAQYPGETYIQLIARLFEGVDYLSALEGKCQTGGRLNLNGALAFTPADLYVAPSGGARFGGLVGGPFSPASRSYRLTNFAAVGLDWTASKTQNWLRISPESGLLAPNESASVTISIKPNAESLPAGNYADTVTFTNHTTGSGSTTRDVTLGIGPIHVKPDGNDANDGSSWLLAKQTVQAGADAAAPGQEVWVAAGTYVECVKQRPAVSLYGGFAGTETERDQRDWATNVTILDGNEESSVVAVPAGADASVAVDGFTLRNGFGLYAGGDWRGGGIYCNSASPTISNNTITENTAYGAGGGICSLGGSPAISNNLITGNLSQHGGGVFCHDSSAVIANNTLADNGYGWGGGIHCDHASPTISNNIIAFNCSGISSWCSTPLLQRNDVYGNYIGSGVSHSYDYLWLPPGPTDISVDPLFVDQPNGDYHLTVASPCIDVGDDALAQSGWQDIDCEPRIQGIHVDIGADEAQAVATPTFAPDGGSYSAAQNVAITCATPGATIHYTTDGDDPTQTDPTIASGSSLLVDVSMVLKARAWESSMVTSAIKCAEYTILGTTGTVATPTFTPDGGAYTSAVTVTIGCANPGATIRYTTDGSDPTEGSALYTDPITIPTTTTLKARAWKSGWDPSGVKAADYAIVSRLYVNLNAPGPIHDGLSWDTAFLTVGDAIHIASSGNEIWVAAGTYNEFNTLRSDVALYGGFAGTETTLEQRDWDTNVTVLNGNMSKPVVGIPAGAGPETVIDGFTVRDGGGYWGGGITCHENSSPVISHNRIIENTFVDWGGGIYCLDATPTITYNLIDSNIARFGGAGIMCVGSSSIISHNDITSNIIVGGEPEFPGFGGGIYCSGDSTPTIEYNVIQNNLASGGGGIECVGSDALISHNDISQNEATFLWDCYGGGIDCVGSSATITDNTITHNWATYVGGGVYCGGGAPTISNNTISWNTSWDGGGVYFYNCSSANVSNNTVMGNAARTGAGISCYYYASPTIANNTVYANAAYGHGGGISCVEYSSPEIYNNTIAGNGATQGGGLSFEVECSPTLSNNIVAFGSSGLYKDSSSSPTVDSNCVYGNRQYDYKDETGNPWDPPGDISDDPLLASNAYGNLHIQPDSPCREAGDDSVVEAGWLDMDDEPRIQGDHVDIGADESDGTPYSITPTIVRVSTDGDDANDGSTWPLAKQTVQAAIDAVSPDGGEIWVKAGAYNEQVVLPSFVYLYGGFDGTETDRDQRDWAANVTVLDGQQAGSVVTAEMGGCMISAVDGFTIRNGSGGWDSGAIYCKAASPIIANNTITRNSMNGDGGGIYCEVAAPVVANNVISSNTSGYSGGGIYCNSSSPFIVNTTVSGNSSEEGAGVSCYWDSSPTITDTIIAFNASGVYKDRSSSPSVTFSDVYGNGEYDYYDESGGPWDPTGTDGNISEDPIFASASYGNLHIQPSSPCVDSGENAAALAWGSYDIDGQDRIQPQGGTVDMGADESDGTIWDVTPLIVRVSSDGDDANDGSTWALAKRTVQAAIDAVAAEGGEVWAREDIYNELITLAPYVHVYGGFGGTETERDQRDWDTYVTVLDGQQSGSVVTASQGYLISTIDGFTIRNGLADQGGGINCDGGSPLIWNNTITGNTATGFGGGGISCFRSSATIRDNIITGNDSSQRGGGVYCNFASPVITNNEISGNTTAWNGGGVRSSSGSIVADNVIIGNSAQRGGGVECAGSTVTNNTIANNIGLFDGGGIYCSFSSPSTISNNIVAFNSSGIHDDSSGAATFSHNDVYGNTEYDYEGTDPGPGDISEDPLFVDLPNDVHLSSASPCINTGDDAAPGMQPTDMDGQPRINGVVDMGADEYLILRVSPGGNDGNNGYSWEAAKRTVQAALDAAVAPADVWVAAGTYTENNVTLKEGVQLCGGFAGTEVTREARDWVANVTILDAGGSGSVVIAPNGTTESTVIDGFTITNGNYYFAGGIMCDGAASPTISHNTITGNDVQYEGAGIYCGNGSPKIVSNIISDNTSGYDAGGIYCGTGAPSILNNTIVANSANSGGGIYCSAGAPTIANNIIAFNPSGSGIYYTGGIPIIGYNDVYGNLPYNYEGIDDPTGTGGNISVDPRLASIPYGNLHIQPDSPCRDAGSNTLVEPAWLDIDGQPRIQPAEGTVDIGADESDGTLWEVIIRVSPTGDDANDGSTWELAKRTVQAAIDAPASGQEVWVATGTYEELIDLRDGVALYGGFAGTETLRSQRDWTTNETVLDAGWINTAVTVDYGATPTTRIDGFTICKGIGVEGAGISCIGASPTIANNRITDNNAAQPTSYGRGGAVCCSSGSTALIENNVIEDNVALKGGGIYTDNSAPTIIDNVILNNHAVYDAYEAGYGGYGGGIYCSDSDATIINNTIVGNTRNNTIGGIGGGIYCDSGAPSIVNNIVAFNTDGISVEGSGAPALSYNDFYGNTEYNYLGVSPGPGDISADPKLASVYYGDMHIQPDSPCVDAGDNSVVGPDWLDMDGQPRIQPEEGTVDMGADESDGTLWEVIIRVSPTGDDANDGSTWELAKRTVQAAIDAGVSCQEIWVAAGIYEENITLNDGVALYGGFAGIETQRDQRDWTVNVTILDGGDSGEVVTISSLPNPITRVDGFTIRNTPLGFGGGIYCTSSSPTIANNTITSNTRGFGGGIYCYSSNSTIVNNMITENVSDYGGAIYCEQCTGSILNNSITDNNSQSHGGGIYLVASSTMIANNVISGNSGYYVGGIYCGDGSPSVINNTIVDNSGMLGGGINCGTGTPTITNNIIAFNAQGYGVYDPGGGSPTLTYNDAYANQPGNYSGLPDPTGTDGNISVDPRLASIPYGNLHIQPDSPCRDAGDNGAVEPGWLDIDGEARIQPVDGTVDIGADESDGTVWQAIIRVSTTGDDANDGSTWELAKRTVQAAIDAPASGQEVWVAAGTYEELIDLRDGVALYGGFAGTETLRSQRDWTTNETVLDAGWINTAVTVDYGATPTTRIDGFTICKGIGVEGAGISCIGASPTIANNRITDNNAAQPTSYGRGGAVCCSSGSTALIENNVIEDNVALKGGGIYTDNSAPTIINNVILNNHAVYDAYEAGYGGYGGGIYLTNSAATILNNTIVGNTRNNTIGGIGGGIYCDSESPDIVNNIIAFNDDGISVEGSGTPTLSYNDVYGNTEYDYYGVTPGTGDISAHPQFVDQAGDDYHLLSTSPCIDAGTNDGVPPTDKDGNPRVQDGDGDGTDVCDMGAYEYQPDLALMKESLPDGTEVEFGPVSVTMTFLCADPSGKNWVYVEKPDRTSGIRVNTISSFSIGDLVNVSGTIETDTTNGERYIQAYPDNPQPAGGTFTVGSLGMRNEWLGGEASGYVPVLKDGFGFYNVGLLVQSWGRVIYVDQSGEYFYMNDGSDLADGSGNIGVRVIVPSGVSAPSYADYVKVTGISSVMKISSQYVRVIRMRIQTDIETVTVWDDSDIIIFSGWNQLALPGIPQVPYPDAVFVGCVDGIPLEGNLKRYDALEQAWITYYVCSPFGNCLMADGFSLYVPPDIDACYYYDRTPVSEDQLVSLPRGSDPVDYFSFIGTPFDYDRSWSSCLVTDGQSVIPLPYAVSVGWIHQVEYWDGSSWQEVTDLSTGDMDARKGYKIYPSADNLAMIVPAQ